MHSHRKITFFLCLLAVIASIIISYKLRWLGDDIFIAFRYIQNFNEGNGWVYNPGERVEGYTDFLWLLILSFFSWLKYDLETITQVLGIIFSAGTITIFSIIGYRVSSAGKKFIFPFMAFALMFNFDYNVWATSGLEVSFVTVLLSAGFYSFFFSKLEHNKKLIVSGLFICLALMTRPDVMLILLSANFLLALANISKGEKFSGIIKEQILFNLPILLIYLPYFEWRYNYYGFIFPNTYYDKLGYETAFPKGFYYIWLYVKCHLTSLLASAALIIPIRLAFKGQWKKLFSDKELAPLLTSLFMVIVYLFFFVAKVGGDFMFARFIIPCVPFIYFIIFYTVYMKAARYANIIFAAILLMSIPETFIRTNLFVETTAEGKEKPLIHEGIADERYIYLYCMHTEHNVSAGKELHELTKDINYKALIFGAQARFGYYANFKYCQEYFGLTDTLIAHSKIEERGRIGHEKHATIEYLESKNIHFSFNAGHLKDDAYRSAQIDLPSGEASMEIITYDKGIIKAFADKLGSKFHYIDFPSYLDNYIRDTIPVASNEKLEADYKKFIPYYFKNNNDPERAAVFTNALKALK